MTPPVPLLEKKWYTYVGDWDFFEQNPERLTDTRYMLDTVYDEVTGPRWEVSLPVPLRRTFFIEERLCEATYNLTGEHLWHEVSRTRIFRHYFLVREIPCADNGKQSNGKDCFCKQHPCFEPVELLVETGEYLPGQWFEGVQPQGFHTDPYLKSLVVNETEVHRGRTNS